MDQWSVKTRLSSSYKLVVGNSIPSPEQFPFSSFFWQKGIMVRKQIYSLVTTVKFSLGHRTDAAPMGAVNRKDGIPHLFLIVTSSARLSQILRPLVMAASPALTEASPPLSSTSWNLQYLWKSTPPPPAFRRERFPQGVLCIASPSPHTDSSLTPHQYGFQSPYSPTAAVVQATTKSLNPMSSFSPTIPSQ